MSPQRTTHFDSTQLACVSCHTRTGVMSHMWSHITYITCHVTPRTTHFDSAQLACVSCHICDRKAWCHTNEVMSHLQCVMSPTENIPYDTAQLACVTCHTYERVMSHIRSLVTHILLCHTNVMCHVTHRTTHFDTAQLACVSRRLSVTIGPRGRGGVQEESCHTYEYAVQRISLHSVQLSTVLPQWIQTHARWSHASKIDTDTCEIIRYTLCSDNPIPYINIFVYMYIHI